MTSLTQSQMSPEVTQRRRCSFPGVSSTFQQLLNQVLSGGLQECRDLTVANNNDINNYIMTLQESSYLKTIWTLQELSNICKVGSLVISFLQSFQPIQWKISHQIIVYMWTYTENFLWDLKLWCWNFDKSPFFWHRLHPDEAKIDNNSSTFQILWISCPFWPSPWQPGGNLESGYWWKTDPVAGW